MKIKVPIKKLKMSAKFRHVCKRLRKWVNIKLNMNLHWTTKQKLSPHFRTHHIICVCEYFTKLTICVCLCLDF